RPERASGRGRESLLGLALAGEEERPDLELDRLEGLDAGAVALSERAELEPAPLDPLQRLERAGVGIDDPVVGDRRAGVERALRHPIARRARGRDDLADPVGHDVDRTLVPRARQPRAAPPADV